MRRWPGTSIRRQRRQDPPRTRSLGRRRRSRPRRLNFRALKAAEPSCTLIEHKPRQGLTGQRIYQDLVTEHGFRASYSSIRRFFRRLGQSQPLPFRLLEVLPGGRARGFSVRVTEDGTDQCGVLYRGRNACTLSTFLRKWCCLGGRTVGSWHDGCDAHLERH